MVNTAKTTINNIIPLQKEKTFSNKLNLIINDYSYLSKRTVTELENIFDEEDINDLVNAIKFTQLESDVLAAQKLIYASYKIYCDSMNISTKYKLEHKILNLNTCQALILKRYLQAYIIHNDINILNCFHSPPNIN